MHRPEIVTMDALSEVLQAVRLTSSLFCRSEAAAPWGVRLDAEADAARFHYVVRGSCWLAVEGRPCPAVALSGGDLVLLPTGDAHTLCDQPHRTVHRFEEALAATEQTTSTGRLRFGGAGASTTLISGCFHIENRATLPLLRTLPPIVRITPDEGRVVPWLEQNLQFIAAEAASDRPGAQLVLTRVADVIFVQALRAYMEGLPDEAEGFLRALRDAHIGAALGFVHRDPGADWTVASLAARVGLSRSVFAERFALLVGEPPLGYLTRLRMEKAAALLRDGGTLAEVAQRTGYGSEASFSRAFRQWAGVPPGAFRRRARAGARSTRSRPDPASELHSDDDFACTFPPPRLRVPPARARRDRGRGRAGGGLGRVRGTRRGVPAGRGDRREADEAASPGADHRG
jgi:AraC-like DNA-binding protein